MYILDSGRFEKMLKEKGFNSILEFARSLGMHRNTVHHYLSGSPVFPSQLEKMLRALDLKPGQAFIEKREKEKDSIKSILPFIDRLQSSNPAATFVLFGSRAEGRERKYSDWDIGIYITEGLTHDAYRKMLRVRDDFQETSPFFIDLINLNQADDEFIKRISKGWRFLGGRLSGWHALLQRIK